MSDAFALDNFAPAETVTFRLRKHGDHDFVVDADPDVDIVAQMLKIEENIRGSEEEADVVAAAAEGKQLLLQLIQEHQPDVTAIRTGMQEVLSIFSLIIRGESVATAVAEAISASSSTSSGESGDGESGDALGLPGVGDTVEDGGPLASAKLSSAPSSGSDAHDASLLATGTA